jgi:hypothetical protein
MASSRFVGGITTIEVEEFALLPKISAAYTITVTT